MSRDDRSPAPELRGDLNWYVRSVSLVTHVLFGILEHIEIDGPVERIPRRGPVIVASNHASNLDSVVIGAWIMPAMGRRLHWLGKKELTELPVLGRFIRAGSVHGIDRGAADIEAFRTALRILEAGHALLIFPEGTRSRTGALQQAHDGAATLALRTRATVVPVGIVGATAAWPLTSLLPRPRRRVVGRVGEPFVLSDVIDPGGDRKRTKELATLELMARIAELLPEDQRGVYAEATAKRTAGRLATHGEGQPGA